MGSYLKSIIAASLLAFSCASTSRRSDMPFPPHLFKPFSAIEYRKYTEYSVANGETANYLTVIPPESTIIIIKSIVNRDNLDELWAQYYKNDILLLRHGKSPTVYGLTEPAQVFEYLRENPIILTQNDTLRVSVWNNSIGVKDMYVELLGYLYTLNEQDLHKEFQERELKSLRR